MPNKNKPNNHKQKSKNEVAQPHDATFKKLFGKPQIAKDVIAQNLPQEILNDMELDSLEKLDGSFASEKLKETFTDIVYGIMTILQEREMKGIEIGIEKGKLELARRFLSMKLTVEQVAEGTNLSIEEVKRLKEELDK